jgi:hypothetical protein
LQFAPKIAMSGALSITNGNHCPPLEAAGLSDLTEKLQPRHTARGIQRRRHGYGHWHREMV